MPYLGRETEYTLRLKQTFRKVKEHIFYYISDSLVYQSYSCTFEDLLQILEGVQKLNCGVYLFAPPKITAPVEGSNSAVRGLALSATIVHRPLKNAIMLMSTVRVEMCFRFSASSIKWIK